MRESSIRSEDTLTGLLTSAAEKFADRIAIEQGERQLSYAELKQRSNELAGFFVDCGLASGSVVALFFESRMEVILTMVACLKAGCAFAPLDPAYPDQRLASMLAHVQPALIMAGPEFRERVDRVVLSCGSNSRVVVLDEKLELSDHRGEEAGNGGGQRFSHSGRPELTMGPDDLCYVYFTSGSEGRPKAIAGRHKGLLHFIKWEIKTFRIDEQYRFSQITPPAFDPFLRDVFVPLCAGATICVPAHLDVIADSRRLVRWIQQSDIALMHIVPTVFRTIVNEHLDPGGFPSLKYVLLAGEHLYPADLKRWFDSVGAGVQLVNLYGPTETTLAKFCHFIQESDKDRRSVPVGKPIEGARALILNEDKGTCQPGVVGEVYIRTPFRSLGYYKQPELTAEVFISNPFNNDPSDIIYKTGDLGRILDDGNFELLGRRDAQVKVRGVRIELGEVENCLREHEAILEAVVIDKENSQKDKFLCAFIVADRELAVPELRDFLLSSLPETMVPAMFIQLEEMPRSLNGKIDRKALRNSNLKSVSASEYVEPANQTEERVAMIWRTALNREQISVTDNLFEAGVHSMMATQVLYRINREFQTELPLKSLFEAPTIRKLSAAVERTIADRLAASRIPPIVPIDRSGPLPLSFAQQRIWFVSQLDPLRPTYNLPFALNITGVLDVTLLERAFDAVLKRHEILRTAFVVIDGLPTQVISPVQSLGLPVVDLRELPRNAAKDEVRRWSNEQAQRPFSLDQSPLLRLLLFRLDDQEHALQITIHHIVFDGWSLNLLMRELAALYSSFSTDGAAFVPELPVQYADYASWQQHWLKGEALEEGLSYWRGELGLKPPAIALPVDYPRPLQPTFRAQAQPLVVSKGITDALQDLSRMESCTLFMTLLAAFQVLLYRYTGQEELVVGSPTANRDRAEIESLIGFFVNMLPLRADLSGTPSFREFLGRIRRVALDAYSHQEVPFEKLVEGLRPERSQNLMPLFQVLFVFQNRPEPMSLPGLKFTATGMRSGIAQYDLVLALAEEEQGLKGFIEFNVDVFAPDTIARMAENFQTLLESIVRDADESISLLPVVNETERRTLLSMAAQFADDSPSEGVTLVQLFEAQVKRTPEATAVVFKDQITYRELNSRADQLARYLTRLGVEPEVTVGICIERSVEMLVGILGILKAGGAYLPLDETHPKSRLLFMLEDAQAPVLLTQQKLIELLPQHQARVVCLDTEWDIIANERGSDPKGPDPENVAYIIYTSGSTGKPKGTLIRHRSASQVISTSIDLLQVGPQSRVSQCFSASFDASVLEIFTALLSGAALHLIERNTLLSGAALTQTLQQQAISVWITTPSLLDMLPDTDFPALRTITVGGEKCSTATAARWSASRRLLNLYAPTEATIYSTAWEYADSRRPAPPIGKPIARTEVYLLDGQQQLVPMGVRGEIYLGGAGLARGYLGRPELTAERFVPHPYSREAGARLYRTGDMGRLLADGNLEYLGRVDHQVKVRGYRIELGEVEAVLLEHAAVQAAAVVPVKAKGEGAEQQLVGYLVVAPEKEVTVGQLRSYLKERLPEYMVPGQLVLLAELPLTAHGKVDRKALAASGPVSPAAETEYIAPVSEVEQIIAAIWQEVLAVDKVGLNDNFFDLGGHSLLLTKLIARLRRDFQVEIPLLSIFRASTLAEQAEVVETALWAATLSNKTSGLVSAQDNMIEGEL